MHRCNHSQGPKVFYTYEIEIMMLYRVLKGTTFTFIGIVILQFSLPILSMAKIHSDDRELIKQLSKARFNLSITNGLVTLNAENADLKAILDEIQKRTGLQIESYGNINQRITISFQELPIDKAINKISGNSGMVFSKERGVKEFQLSRVVISESSKDQIESLGDGTSGNTTTTKSENQNFKKFSTNNNITESFVDISVSIIKPITDSGAIPQTVTNELIVQFSAGVSTEEIKALAAKIGATIKEQIAVLSYYVLTLPDGISVDQALKHFTENEHVQIAEPNYLISLQSMPNDPLFSSQWALNNTVQAEKPEQANINMVAAWDLEQGNSGVVIAVIDTGIDYNHEDLAANVWHNPGEIPGNGIDDDHNGYIDDIIGWDFVDARMGAEDEDFSDPDNDPLDRQGHGTLVAGIAAAVGNNGLGITGITWNSKIMPVRAAYKTKHWDAMLESDDAARAIIYAAENGAHVINLSWGSNINSKLIESAIAFAADSGALVCAAAGNQNNNAPFYPAASDIDAIIAVGATGKDGNKAYMSNFGDWVDVSAPGVSIYSTYLNNQYAFQTGTSMATAVVSGIAGLIWSWNHNLTNYEVKNAIVNSADKPESQIGALPKINAYKALLYVKLQAFVDHFCQERLSISTNETNLDNRVSSSGNDMLREAGNAYKFIFNDEFAGMHMTSEEYLCLLYRAFFGREPDAKGYSGHVNGLYNGVSRQTILNGFIYSQEFEHLCESYSLQP